MPSIALPLGTRAESVANQSEGYLSSAGPNTKGTENIGIFALPVGPVFGENDQGWFWTPKWQQMEAEASSDIIAGRVTRFASDDEFARAMDELLSDADL